MKSTQRIMLAVTAGVLAVGAAVGAHLVSAGHRASTEAGSGTDGGTAETPTPPASTAPPAADRTGLPIAEAILGRWQAPEPANQNAFVEFTEYGLWFASDGCNRSSGIYRLASDGSFESPGNALMTGVACDNVEIPSSVWGAQRAEVTADGALTLTVADGGTMELLLARADPVSLAGRWEPIDEEGNQTPDEGYVEIAADGSWEGSYGCNSASGNWALVPQEPGDPDLADYFGGLGRLVISNPTGGPK